jgi:hypothetical protein
MQAFSSILGSNGSLNDQNNSKKPIECKKDLLFTLLPIEIRIRNVKVIQLSLLN